MATRKTFRDLVDDARREGRAEHLRPRHVATIAARCDLSRAHLYNLMRGTKRAPPWTVARIARGLGLTTAAVQSAMDRTLIEAVAE